MQYCFVFLAQLFLNSFTLEMERCHKEILWNLVVYVGNIYAIMKDKNLI